jgi:hypothetical protein
MAIATAIMAGVGGAASLIQGISARRQAKDARNSAQEAMRQARQEAQINYIESLRVPTEAYDRAFDASVARQRQSVQALQEGGIRGQEGGIGKINAVADATDFQTRQAMADRLFNLEKTKAQEKGRIRDEVVDMKLAQAQEQNIRASEQEQLSASAITSGIKGLGASAAGFLESAGLFGDGDAKGLASDVSDAGFAGDMSSDEVARELSKNFTPDEINRMSEMVKNNQNPFASLGSQSFDLRAAFGTPNF